MLRLELIEAPHQLVEAMAVAAYAIGAARRLRPEHAQLPDDAIVYCSFGDASANHSTAQGAFNTAGWTSYQSIPLPLLFVCLCCPRVDALAVEPQYPAYTGYVNDYAGVLDQAMKALSAATGLNTAGPDPETPVH